MNVITHVYDEDNSSKGFPIKKILERGPDELRKLKNKMESLDNNFKLYCAHTKQRVTLIELDTEKFEFRFYSNIDSQHKGLDPHLYSKLHAAGIIDKLLCKSCQNKDNFRNVACFIYCSDCGKEIKY